MKKLLLTILLNHLVLAVTYSQTNINNDANQIYKDSDTELNELYKEILKEYSTDTIFIQAFRTSQLNWIKFRDSELKMKYPDRGSSG